MVIPKLDYHLCTGYTKQFELIASKFFVYSEWHSTYSPHERESGSRNPGNFCSWNPESRVLKSGIQLKESGIPLTIGIQNLSSPDKDWNPVPGIRNPRSGIQNPRLSWILLVRRFVARMSSKDCVIVWRQKKSNVVTSTSLRRI